MGHLGISFGAKLGLQSVYSRSKHILKEEVHFLFHSEPVKGLDEILHIILSFLRGDLKRYFMHFGQYFTEIGSKSWLFPFHSLKFIKERNGLEFIDNLPPRCLSSLPGGTPSSGRKRCQTSASHCHSLDSDVCVRIVTSSTSRTRSGLDRAFLEVKK